MPSFDVVSEVDTHELSNAIDQAMREVSTRFDLKGSDAKIELKDSVIKIEAEKGKAEPRGKRAYQDITVKQGIEKEDAKKIVKMVKEMKVKVQAAIQGEQVRITALYKLRACANELFCIFLRLTPG